MNRPLDDGEEDIEQTLYRLKNELDDINLLNADIQIENHKKDLLLEKKEAELKKLKDIFIEDMEQLELDHDYFEEDQEFQVQVQDERVRSLTLKKQRLDNIEEDNAELKLSIVRVEQRLRKEGFNHASVIHNLNKSMQTLRSEMEVTLRRKLAEMDANFQQISYAGLSDQKKQALLTNAKLKDETTLQNSGMSNLETRLATQQASSASVRYDLYSLEDQEENARDYIGNLLSAKATTMKSVNSIKEKDLELSALKEKIVAELKLTPLMKEIQEMASECDELIEKEGKLVTLWDLRLNNLQKLRTLISPLTPFEESGYYDASSFKLTMIPSMEIKSTDLDDSANGSNLSKVHKESLELNSSSYSTNKDEDIDSNQSDADNYTVKLSLFRDVLSKNKSLSKALLPIRGKEAMLLSKALPIPINENDNEKNNNTASGNSDDKNDEYIDKKMGEISDIIPVPKLAQNMVSWSTLEVLKIWRETQQLIDEIDNKQDNIHETDTRDSVEEMKEREEGGSPLSYDGMGSPARSPKFVSNDDKFISIDDKFVSKDEKWLIEARNIAINDNEKNKTIITKIKPGTFSSQEELNYTPSLSNLNTYDLRPPLKVKRKKSKENQKNYNLDRLSLSLNSNEKSTLSRDSLFDSMLSSKSAIMPKVLNKISSKNLRGVMKDPIASNVSTLKSAFIANSLAHSLKPESQSPEVQTSTFSNAYKKAPKPRYGSDLKIRDYLKDLSYARNGCDSIHLYSKHL